jgi:hypothetical protein
MINHIVLMNLSNNADQEIIDELMSYANRIRETINEVKHYEIIPNIANGSKGFNWAILSRFDNESEMNAYKQNELHQEFVTFLDSYTDDLLFLDYN